MSLIYIFQNPSDRRQYRRMYGMLDNPEGLLKRKGKKPHKLQLCHLNLIPPHEMAQKTLVSLLRRWALWVGSHKEALEWNGRLYNAIFAARVKYDYCPHVYDILLSMGNLMKRTSYKDWKVRMVFNSIQLASFTYTFLFTAFPFYLCSKSKFIFRHRFRNNRARGASIFYD